MKKFAIILILLGSVFMFSAFKTPETYEIEAQKNANIHNNKGIMYMKDYWWYAAIQEFKIAISLNPNTQATSVYYKNIGDAYMAIGYPNMARQPYEDAIRQYNLNFQYYQNLAKCYKSLGLVDAKIQEYSKDKNILNKVMLGILYVESGNKKRGIIILDEFAMSEPDLIITTAVKKYIKDTVKHVDDL